MCTNVAELLLPLVMFDEAHDVVLFGQLDELNVMLKFLDGWLRHKNVNTSLNSVFGDWIMGTCRCFQ